jgi:hypothetical protein
MRGAIFLAAVMLCACHSADLRGPGPSNPSVVGTPGNKAVENAPPANQPTNYGYGSAYDPHGAGGLAQPGTPWETGAVPIVPVPASSANQMGVPPPVTDPKR